MTSAYPKVSLGELLRLERRPTSVLPNGQYQEIGVYCFGRGIFHKLPRTGLEVGDKDLFLLKEGDFILQVTFAWEGAIAIVSAAEDGMYGSTRYPTFRVDEDRCVPKFLLLYFRTEEGLQQLANICPGSAGRNRVLSIKRIPEVLVPLPSMSEQRRILARIEELARSIDEAYDLRKAAAEETNSIIDALLHTFYESLTTQYGLAKLDDVIVDSDYGSSVKCTPDRGDGCIPVLRIPNIASERVELDDLKFGHLSDRELKQLLLSRGDILIVRTNGSVNLVGRCAVVDHMPEPTAFASYLIRLKFDSSLILPLYAQSMLRYLRVSGRLIDFARTTAGQYNVSVGRLRAAQIPVPPLADQERIVSKLHAVRERVEEVTSLNSQVAAELEALMPSIIDKAFRGEL